MLGKPIRIATRQSKLALWQAEHVRERLKSLFEGRPIELVPVQSTGDLVRDRALHEIGGVGLFTKEIQAAVLENRADLAVHSLKDLPTAATPGLVIIAVPQRGNPADALVTRSKGFWDLPKKAKVGTSSLRRRAQLLRHRPDIEVVDLRGNVETRLRKLKEDSLDAVILAAAGLERLGLAHEISETLDSELVLPAVGQGALAIECREEDGELRQTLATLDHVSTRRAVTAERALLAALEGGCQAPIAAHAIHHIEQLTLRALVLSRDGESWCGGTVFGNTETDPEWLGRDLAQRLLDQGARDLLLPSRRP